MVQHVCAQMMQEGSIPSMLVCCCPADSDEAHDDHSEPCPDHAPEPADGLVSDVLLSGDACCDVEMQQASDEAIHPRIAAASDMQVPLAASMQATSIPHAQRTVVTLLSDRAPPLTALQSLFIRNSSFLI